MKDDTVNKLIFLKLILTIRFYELLTSESKHTCSPLIFLTIGCELHW